MSCSSAIYAINSLSTTVIANQIIPLTSVIRKKGGACALSNLGILISQAGYYQVTASVTQAIASPGSIVVRLYKDGVQIPGAVATATTTANAQTQSLSVSALVRQTCCQSPSVITIVTQSAGNVTNAAMIVEKV